MADTFNWCFIGAGPLARTVAGEMALIRGRSHKIVSLYADDKSDAKSLSVWYGGKVYDTIEEAVNADGVDAVYISTPNSTHYEIAKKCIELGKPVLCEKPVATSYEQACELFELAEQNGVYLTEAVWVLFNSVAKKVVEWINNGDIGEVKKVDLRFTFRNSRFYQAPLCMSKELGGGTLFEVGTVPLCCCYNILGEPETIKCEGKVNEEGVDTEETIVTTYKGGVECTVHLSVSNYTGRENATITGTKGMIVIPLFNSTIKAKLITPVKRDSSGNFPSVMNVFDLVADEIRDNKITSSFVRKETILGVIKIIDECYKQLGL